MQSRQTRNEAPATRALDGDSTGAALTVANLSKRFGPTCALDDVGFNVRRGEIHGLVGGNGSGKSTLIKILAGVHRGDPGGTVTLAGHTVDSDATSPELARRCGLRFVHQNPGVFSVLTVAENMALGSAEGFPTRMGGISWSRLRRRTCELLERFEISAEPDDVLEDLRPADHTMIAIARALQGKGGGESDDVSLLVLDEPTASLPEHEVQILLDALRRYAQAGFAILYVSHRLEEVLSVVDSVTVLRNGRHVITRAAKGLSQDELIEHIVGRPLERLYAETAERSITDPLFEVAGLRGGPLRDVGFGVRRGEIVGIAGLLGSGRTELLRMIFGAYPADGGEMRLDGEALRPCSPAEAMELGLGYIPEHRERDAAFPDLSVRENLSAGEIARYWRRTGFRHAHERADADRSIDEFSIRTDGSRALFSSLSGGNQQKVVLARWLRRQPRLLLLDEPTQGVDVGARADVYALVRKAVGDGMAVVLVTSDLEELAHVSDRVLVLREGRIVAEVQGDDLEAHTLNALVLEEERKAA